jgi:hypothetical protein
MGDALRGDDDDGPTGGPPAAAAATRDDACIAAVLTEAFRAEEDGVHTDELFARACQAAELGAGAVASRLTALSPACWSRPPPSLVPVHTDHARLQALLQQHGLEVGAFAPTGPKPFLTVPGFFSPQEANVAGDGACQFRALSDQLYRSEKYHAAVRSAVVTQLQSAPQLYAAFVSDWPSYEAFCRAMAEPSTWGDHVTLQAAADAYGCRVAVLTTYAEAAFLEVLPRDARTQRCLWLALHAEVHYRSIYPKGEVPAVGQARVEQLERDGSSI